MEAPVQREIEGAGYLLQVFTLNQVALKTGLGKKMLTANVRKMMEKLKAADMEELIKLLAKQLEIQDKKVHLTDHVLKNKIMKQDKKILQLISLTVVYSNNRFFLFFYQIFYNVLRTHQPVRIFNQGSGTLIPIIESLNKRL